MKRLTIIASGKVQGVFYRAHCKQEAEKFGVKGYAKNMPDNTVKIIAEGDTEPLDHFVREIKRGPLMAFIQNLDIEESESTDEFSGFDVR